MFSFRQDGILFPSIPQLLNFFYQSVCSSITVSSLSVYLSEQHLAFALSAQKCSLIETRDGHEMVKLLQMTTARDGHSRRGFAAKNWIT